MSLLSVGAVGSACTRTRSSAPAGGGTQAVVPPKACVNPLRARVEGLLKTNADQFREGVAKRTAVFDLVFPADVNQYQALNKFAILGVKILGRNASDFPISSVYYVEASGRKSSLTVFPLIARTDPKEIRTAGSAPITPLGANSEELYYLIPIYLLREAGELGVRFKDRVSTLTLGRFPIEVALPFVVQDPQPRPDAARAPDAGLVVSLVEQFYCLPLRSFHRGGAPSLQEKKS